MSKQKVKLVQITEENFTQLARRIQKFLHHQDVVSWHMFNCKAKRHIPQKVVIEDRSFLTKKRHKYVTTTATRYSCPEVVIVTPDTYPKVFDHSFIRINLAEGYGGIVHVGDYVGFTGNRMHLRSRMLLETEKFIYEVYQKWDPHGGFGDLRPTSDPMWAEYDEMI